MELLQSLLLALIGVIGIPSLSLLSWAIYYDLYRSEIPPGFDSPLKLRGLHCLAIMAFTAGKCLELLGVCRQVAVIRFLQSFWNPRADPSLSSKDLHFDGVPVRVYQPKTPSAGPRKGFVFFHGGAGMVGSIAFYEDVCSKIAKETDSVVVSVGYRLSPQHLPPAQYKDCLAATIHLIQNAASHGVDPSKIIVGGDSAGGNYACIVAQKLVEISDLPKLRAQVIIYPYTQAMDLNLPSYQQNSSMPILFRENVAYFGLKYTGKDPSLLGQVLKGSHVPDSMRLKYGKWLSPDNLPERFKGRGYKQVPLAPYEPEAYRQLSETLEADFSCLFAEDTVIQKLPETLIVSCEYDVVRDDALLYKKRLEDNGVKVSWFHVENGFHGMINFFKGCIFAFPTAVELTDSIVDFVKNL
ncbi:arylacetamide deacetylase-like 4 [Podarcis lilfordi]|uniref:Arylacetamide deacetylase-like 4 n=1 Tax=Podarcis lilfordi TaxID=74358 RepID=A0AA35QQC3_9SAUR|nr:arylacetamide deacetylase-like 4 [Podarcis lilfordi]CAI7935055.1 arylacetamide deacetylase-like 4 [Podarcis lilfordi]